MRRAFVTGVSGTELTAGELVFIADTRPWGLILFARNVANPEQVAALVGAFRAAVGDARAPVLVDQEGGRVQRLRQPFWSDFPPASAIGRLHAENPALGVRAAYLKARLIGEDLARLGIDVVCAPALDLGLPHSHPVIGERAFAADPGVVATLGRATVEGFLDAGVLPVMKHLPGHGRGMVDSHLELPVVTTPRAELEATDFAAFRPLADCPIGMTAHIQFTDLDATRPATQSATVVAEIVRGHIGFDGLLLSDDLGMKALGEDFKTRTARTLEAGVDVALHCSGDMGEMVQVAAGTPPLAGAAARRAETALAARRPPKPFDREQAQSALSEALAQVGLASTFAPARGSAWSRHP